MTDEEDDPFADLDAPDDADPFEDLADAENSDQNRRSGSGDSEPEPGIDGETPPGRMPDDPFERRHGDATAEGESDANSTDAGGETPSGDGLHEPRETGGATDSPTPDGPAGTTDTADPTDDPFASFSSTQDTSDPFEAFEDASVDEVDPDAVWEDLKSDTTPLSEAEEKVYAEVSKHRYCERCPHFSGPPDTDCTYEGAAIVEFLDMATVRVVNCPIVAEQRDLEDGTTDL